MKVQQLHLTHLDNNTDAVLKISNVQFEAFRDKQDENFGSGKYTSFIILSMGRAHQYFFSNYSECVKTFWGRFF